MRVYIHVRRLYDSGLILQVLVLVTSHSPKDGVIHCGTDLRVKVTRERVSMNCEMRLSFQ